MQKAQVYAKHNRARIGPKKVAIVMDKVRGKSLRDAKIFLAFDPTKASKLILKVLRSAESNAKTNTNLNPDNLYLSDIRVDGGRTHKWGRPGSKGRFNPIIKRTSHITVGLSEREGIKVKNSKKKSTKQKKEDKK